MEILHSQNGLVCISDISAAMVHCRALENAERVAVQSFVYAVRSGLQMLWENPCRFSRLSSLKHG